MSEQPKFMVDVYAIVRKNEDLIKLVKKLKENIKFQEKVIKDKVDKIKTLEKRIETMKNHKEVIVHKKKKRPPSAPSKKKIKQSSEMSKQLQKQMTGISVNTFHKSEEEDNVLTLQNNRLTQNEKHLSGFIDSNRDHLLTNKRFKLMKAKTKMSFLTPIKKNSEKRLSPSMKKINKPLKKSLSPYSWRNKPKEAKTSEVQLAAHRMISFRLK